MDIASSALVTDDDPRSEGAMPRLPCLPVLTILLLLQFENNFGHISQAETMAPPATDYQRVAKKTKWVWDGQQASLLYSVTQHLLDYEVEIICPKWTKEKPSPALTVSIRRQEVYSFEAHRNTVFTRFGDTLFVAEPQRGGSGCAVIACDFKARKQLWKSRLQSISNRPHSGYYNAVTIDNNGEALIIRGNESLLRYVEYVDMKTGATLAQREYPRG
jgi:hypothetical protein